MTMNSMIPQSISSIRKCLTWLQSIKDKLNQTSIRVNCWFCNENSIINIADKDGWTCRDCEQFNGFTPDGDYNRPIKEQQDIKLHKTGVLCSSDQVQKVPSLLCEACSQNQVIKVRQLAAFAPFNEFEYDKEIDMYKDYLENVYTLCSKCQKGVTDYLRTQNAAIVDKMDQTQKKILDNLSKKDDLSEDDPVTVTVNTRHHRVMMLKMVFFLSTIFPALLLIASLRLYMGSSALAVGSLNTGYFSQFGGYLVSSIPARLALDMERKAVFSGAVVCLVGLFFTGKYRLYPEDALHLLLWLLTTVNGFALLAVPLTWTIALNFVTLVTSIKCCTRNRVPRNISFNMVHRKNISRISTSAADSDENKRAVHDKAVFSNDVSKLDSSCKSELPNLEGLVDKNPHFETILQNLESFSLGLGKKSGSSSSIWSQAPVVTSSSTDLSPDSSSDIQVQPKQLLSPSRLGFLSFDSRSSSKDGNSRSPSPWSPISSTSTGASNSFTSLVNSAEQLGTPTQPRWSEPEVTMSKPCGSTHQQGYLGPRHSGSYTEFQQVPPAKETNWSDHRQGPCDSQMCESSFQSVIPKPWQDKGNNSASEPMNQNFLESLSLNPKPKPLRRSQRIAMAGRLPKPWPLQKSLSCTNAYDSHNFKSIWHTIPESIVHSRANFDSLGHARESDNVKVQEDPPVQGRPKSKLRSPKIKLNKGVKNQKSSMGEISDDDREDWQLDWSHGPGSYRELKSDFSWRWILLGLLIGVSVTTNVFLVLNRYMPSAL